MQWRLRYGNPKVLPNGALECSEEVELIEAKDYTQAGELADAFLARGDVVYKGRNYRRIFLRLTCGTLSREGQAAADAFFAHKSVHPLPVPYKELSPLQKRMQDGPV